MSTWFATLMAWWGTLVGQADVDVECLVLGGLDVARAHAYAVDDPRLLDQVYSDDELRSADERVMRAYRARGLVLGGVGTERLSCRVARRDDGRVQLDVVDRLGGAWVDQGGRRTSLPTDEPSRRTIVLASTPEGWRVASVA